MIGIVKFEDALNQSYEKNMDLILVGDGNIPVVKLADVNKLLYEQKKKQKEQKKHQPQQKLKELIFGFNIGDNDFKTKIKHAREFLEDGDKLKITIKMDKRLLSSNSKFGFDLINKVIDELSDISEYKDAPAINNGVIYVILSKISKKSN